MKLIHISEQSTSVISTFEKKMTEKYNLTSFWLFDKGDDLFLNTIIVSEKKQGTGTKVMNELITLADKLNKRIVLTTGIANPTHGTTSSGRLKKFYKRFGFVENKGRNKDFSISGNMYREPNTS